MSDYKHKLLARQIRRHFPDGIPPEMEAFVREVEQSYTQYDADRKLMEHSMEISSEELFQKNRELEQKNASQDSFIYRVSHDLKTPANNVIAMTDMLQQHLGDCKNDRLALQMLSHLESAGKVMLSRLQDLLELTRIEKSLNLEPEAIPLESIMYEVLGNLAMEIDKSDAKITMDFEECPTLFISKENLRSLLDNLVGNALKYRSPDRKPLVQLKSRRHGPWALLEIKDNGLGINLERDRQKLFGMFNRFHSHVDGTGVGLYIVKKITEASGGKVEVESQLNQGTTFKLYLAHKAIPASAEHA